MITLTRTLRLNELEIFNVFKNGALICITILEDTRQPYSEQDLQLDPLCSMQEEDLIIVENVFKFYIVDDKPLSAVDSRYVHEFFADLIETNDFTNFIMQDFVYPDMYELIDLHKLNAYQKILQHVGSSYKIPPISKNKWNHLSQQS